MKIVFFGTSEFSVTILKHLLSSPHQVMGIVTKPDQPQGRSLKYFPSPVKEWAQKEVPLTPLYEPDKASSDEFVALMQSHAPDIFVVAAYGEIMKTPLLNVPRLCPINVHASLLPKWRGAAPIQRSLMAGESKTGVTIMKMVLKMDAGDILDAAVVNVTLEMNHKELEELLAEAAKEPLLRVLSKLEAGTLEWELQDPSQVTFAAKITAADTQIDWTKSAFEIHNQIRALAPMPGAWTQIKLGEETKKLKIKRSLPTQRPQNLLTQQEWVIECGKDYLSLLEVQLEGKKTLPISEFLRGFQHKPHIL